MVKRVRRFRMAVIGILAGYLATVVVTGIGGRIVMRIIAIADPGTQTEFTGGGTMTIVAIGAVILGGVGAVGGLLFVAIRRFLPGSWIMKGMGFGTLWLVILGWIFLTSFGFESISDFDPLFLGIGLFAGLHFLYGVALAGLVTLLNHWVPGVRQN